MKIYRVMTGYGTDFYGYSDNTEQAKYFLDKEKALALYKTGERTTRKTLITTTYKDGTQITSETGEKFFERRKNEAKPNEKVELVEEKVNLFRFEEIEVEE